MRAFLVVLAIAALFGASSSTHAQIVRGWGVKAGLAFSDVHSPPLAGFPDFNAETRRVRGFAAHAFGEWLNVPHFSVVTEAGYAQRGYYNEQLYMNQAGTNLQTVKIITRFHYMSAAVLAKGRYQTRGAVPYLLVGPHLDILVGAPDGGLAEEYAATAIGGTYGLGVEVPHVLPVVVFVEARYHVDYTNSLPDVPRDAYNNVVDVLLGIRFQ